MQNSASKHTYYRLPYCRRSHHVAGPSMYRGTLRGSIDVKWDEVLEDGCPILDRTKKKPMSMLDVWNFCERKHEKKLYQVALLERPK